MKYRRKMEFVFIPTSFIATDSLIPIRTRLRVAVRRKSCGISPGSPARLHAECQTP
jgi:hypothetical protein